MHYMLLFVSISNVTVVVFPSPKYFKEKIRKIIVFFPPVLIHLKWIWAMQAKPHVIYYPSVTLQRFSREISIRFEQAKILVK